MADNGHGEVKTDLKLCPFLNKECITEKCTVYIELRHASGLQKIGACSFSAVALFLSEINQNTRPPQRGLPLNLFKG